MFWLESDTFHDDAIWETLAGGNADRIDALQAAYCRLKSHAAHQRRDGYVTARAALQQCRGRRQLLELLCTAVLDRPPLVHRRGDKCDCLGDDPWTEGYPHRIHEFLKRNPSRREYDRSRAQRADLRDSRLKKQVFDRDGGCCRYCASGPLSPRAVRAKDRRKALTYDHVDPDAAAGPDGANLVTACARCNEHKGHRTPAEADMVLLPVPPAALAAVWKASEQILFDPDLDQNQRRINDESTTNQKHDDETDQKHELDSVVDPAGDPNNEPRPPVRPQRTPNKPSHLLEQTPPGSPLGRGGQPGLIPPSDRPPEQPERTGQHPDVYHRRSRAAPALPPEPPYVWPPGAVPTRPPDPEESHHG